MELTASGHTGINANWSCTRRSGVLHPVQGTGPYCGPMCPDIPPVPHKPVTTSPSPTPGLATMVRPRFQVRRHPESLAGICVTWNKGRCTLAHASIGMSVQHANRCTWLGTASSCRRTRSDYKAAVNYQARGQPTPYSRPKPFL